MSPFLNDWYACFIQITTIWYIMTFISNPRILTSRSWLTHIKVWAKFGPFRFLLTCRDGTTYVSHFQNKNFKRWLKKGGQWTRRANSLSWIKADGCRVLTLTKSKECIQSKCRLMIWQNSLHEKSSILSFILGERRHCGNFNFWQSDRQE